MQPVDEDALPQHAKTWPEGITAPEDVSAASDDKPRRSMKHSSPQRVKNLMRAKSRASLTRCGNRRGALSEDSKDSLPVASQVSSHSSSIKNAIDEFSSSGILVDMIERTKAKEGAWSTTAEDWFTNFMLSKPKVYNGAFLADATGMFHREQLHWELMSGIVDEEKREGLLPKTGFKELIKQAQSVRKFKKMNLCIAQEISNWTMRAKLLGFRFSGFLEEEVGVRIDERLGRHTDFWNMYHDRARDQRDIVDSDEEENEQSSAVGSTLSKFGDIMMPLTAWPTSGTPSQTQIQDSKLANWPRQGKHVEKRLQRPGSSNMLRSCSSNHVGCFRRPNLESPSSLEPLSKSGSLPTLSRPKPVAVERSQMPLLFDSRSPSKPASRPVSRPGSAVRRPGSANRPTSATRFSAAGSSRPGSASIFARSGKRPTSPKKERPRSPSPGLYSTYPSVSPGSPRSPTRPSSAASRRRYLQECDNRFTVPDPLAFNTGHSDKYEAKSRGLRDEDLLTVTGTLMTTPKLDSIILSDNIQITDKGLAPFLHEFLNVRHLPEGLSNISLDNCKGIGRRSFDAVLQILDAASNLREINLSGVKIGSRYQLPLATAIGDHESLLSVGLARTGLGGTCITSECLSKILSSKHNRSLDLSWNVFNQQEFQVFGAMIVANNILEHLLIDNCAGYTVGKDTPVSELIERLSHDSSLRSLSVCTNRIDFRGALVIEDSLEEHCKLTRLYLRNNPMGSLGLRSILRLICRPSSRLSRLDVQGCYNGTLGEEVKSGDERLTEVFSFTNPGGKYRLDLSVPYNRALCRMLYETADRFGLDPEKAFVNLHYSKPGYQHPSQDEIGQYKVPRDGVLSFTFNVESAIEVQYSGIDDDDYVGFLNKHLQTTRFTPQFQHVMPLLANWSELDGMSKEQHNFLSAMAADFNMIVPYLHSMCKACPGMANHLLFTLIPSIQRDGNSLFLAQSLFSGVTDLVKTSLRMESFLNFNPQNAQGHYKLNLENSADFAVAQQLLLLDRWESVVNKRRERVDTSQRCNRSQIRNEFHQGASLHTYFKNLTEWAVPEYGEFECDFVTCYRAPNSAKPLSDFLWEKIMVCMYDSACRPSDRLKVLRQISHNFFVDSMHIRQMLGYFRDDLDREEAVVIFWVRVIDRYNSKVFRVRFEKQEDVARLQGRLGYAAFFPFIQPENAIIDLNLAVHDQRLCASIFVQMMLKEKIGNIKEAVWIHGDGKVDNLLMGVPRSWAEPKSVPTSGRFLGKYICAPEDRQFNLRRMLAVKYGYQHADVSISDVKWWTGLTEPPDDVLDLLEFLLSRFKNVDEVFYKIDGSAAGSTGNGEITLREFEEGLKEMECHKFEGPEEKIRIGNIFRYLDPGGEGSISLDEWRVLGQLWSEFELSIQEFVQFVIRAFGENLQDAWEALDDDGSGELSEAEFFEAVKNIGYFGPARVVFALIDSSDDGNISADEFQILDKYKPPDKT
eukprot:TRINITY_DN60961_c0_g1_i1.p1 TRINITY_DN60961_c0_g1~~TRINITY_DN60961_c0_g1_i1.p1  ORF type:complete len:1472 (-),score=264.42 TRINITY_DN60961_c0_g1_i1:6-4421(-)